MRVLRVWDRGIPWSYSSPSCSPRMSIPQYPPVSPGVGRGGSALDLEQWTGQLGVRGRRPPSVLFALSLLLCWPLCLLLRPGPCPSLPWPGILPHLPLLTPPPPPPACFSLLWSASLEAIVSRLAVTLQVTGYRGEGITQWGSLQAKALFAFSFVFPPDYSGADLARISKNQKGKSPPLVGGGVGSHEAVS